MSSLIVNPPSQEHPSEPLVFGPAVNNADFRRIKTRMALECFKWDTQVSDTSTLCPHPLFIEQETWLELSHMAEGLAAELSEAEQELLSQPKLWKIIALPRRLRHIFKNASANGCAPAAFRVLRFDFHYTTDGWRISEVNSDVPGGYTEASCFPQLMADCFACARSAGDPVNDWIKAMLSVVGEIANIALLSAPGFLEDQQITAFLSGKLQAHGVNTVLLHHPQQLEWRTGRAYAELSGKRVAMDAIVRFYQSEWLATLQRGSGWEWLFTGKTPIVNPATSVLTESKRFPLTWDSLSSKMNRWRKLLPECSDPREVSWLNGDNWVLKEAFSNTGDSVHTRDWMDRASWKRLCSSVRRHPDRWIAQRRFEPVAVQLAGKAVYPCIGVYTINGRTAGAYARATTKKFIDYEALDVALLAINQSC